MQRVRILGIDPGFDRLGVSVIDKEGNKETLVFSTCIETSKKDSFGKRLALIGKELQTIITTHAPHEMAIESLFITKNQKTAIMVAEVRGVCIYVASLNNLVMYEYSPPHIKLAITGYGKATKEDISLMVTRILKLSPSKKILDDEMDAIAIALTHSANRQNKLILQEFL